MSSTLSQLCVHALAAVTSQTSFFSSSLLIYCRLTSTPTDPVFFSCGSHQGHPKRVSVLWSCWSSPASVFDSVSRSLPGATFPWLLRCPRPQGYLLCLCPLGFVRGFPLSLPDSCPMVVFSWVQFSDSMLISVLAPSPHLCRASAIILGGDGFLAPSSQTSVISCTYVHPSAYWTSPFGYSGVFGRSSVSILKTGHIHPLLLTKGFSHLTQCRKYSIILTVHLQDIHHQSLC